MDTDAHFLAEAAEGDRSLATIALNGSLLAVLAQKQLLDAEELNFIAASAALACRAQGSEGSAALIEMMVPTSVGVDVQQAAARLGMPLDKANAQ